QQSIGKRMKYPVISEHPLRCPNSLLFELPDSITDRDLHPIGEDVVVRRRHELVRKISDGSDRIEAVALEGSESILIGKE
ncbi:hypothetical protein PMAYCL1PPCAC_25619, partial [Pristionchus mayeri]